MGKAVVKKPAQWQQEFGRRVRELRLQADMSQMALAQGAGVHPTYISSVELGHRNVGLVNIRALAAALNVPPADLLR